MPMGASPAESLYKWPDVGMGQRTTERLRAGKRAAKYIACGVCEERVLSLFPTSADADSISRIIDGDTLKEFLGDAKQLCGMRDLARLFRSRRLEVDPKPDGSAELAQVPHNSIAPFYEEINTSELAFHWKSFAVQHACSETFRRDGDTIANGVVQSYRTMDGAHGDDVQDRWREKLVSAVRAGCRIARSCKAVTRLKGPPHRSAGGRTEQEL